VVHLIRGVLAVAALGLAASAQAAEEPKAEGGGGKGVTVTTGALTTEINGDFRSELIMDDHGLEKIGTAKPDRTTNLQVSNAQVILHGNYNKDTDYAFRFNLLNPGGGVPLDYGYGTHWFSKMIGFSIGKMRVMQGGWDHMDSDYRTMAMGVYSQNLAYNDFDPMFAFHVKVGGTLTLQLLNDVTTANSPEPTPGEYNKNEHPTWVVGWLGEFGPIKPLVDFGSYDNNKSRWFDIAIKTSMNGLNATLGYWDKNQVHKYVSASDATKKVDDPDHSTSITLNVSYEVKHLMTPWFYFSTFDNAEADDKNVAPAVKDIDYNADPTKDATGNVVQHFNDNGMVWGIGVEMNDMGKGWTPFLSIVNTSGKFKKIPGDATSETETRSDMTYSLGVLGEI
jgi:hypothetical protein